MGHRGRLVFFADVDGYHRDIFSQATLQHQVAAQDPVLCRAVRQAVATVLTERQREIVEGHFFTGLSQSQLARQLGVTQQVIQKTLYGTKRKGRMVGGALRKLRVALAPLMRDPS